VVSVGLLNNDRTVISRTYTWRPLACLPILKTSSFSIVNKDWQAQLYHTGHAMSHIVADAVETARPPCPINLTTANVRLQIPVLQHPRVVMNYTRVPK
jgi:hypothetical protein